MPHLASISHPQPFQTGLGCKAACSLRASKRSSTLNSPNDRLSAYKVLPPIPLSVLWRKTQVFPSSTGTFTSINHISMLLQDEESMVTSTTSRRDMVAATVLSSLALKLSQPSPAFAVQGLTAGRIPGLSLGMSKCCKLFPHAVSVYLSRRFLSSPFVGLHSALSRCTGLSKETDDEGFHTYRRPEGKSGGHGVGWSEIPQYTFKACLIPCNHD